METMRYTETKKGSKAIVIGLLLFFLIGGVTIWYLLKTEKEPTLIGKENSEINSLENVDKKDPEANKEKAQNTKYEITKKEYSDNSNTKMKGSFEIPVISINSTEITELNEKIEKQYKELFEELKNQNKNAENNYTYIVSYNTYDNMVENQRIISITIYDRIRDDSSKKNSMDKITSYNIDILTAKEVEQSDVAFAMFGKDYKTKINDAVKKYVITNKMANESEFSYTSTGLETYYIKDGKFHIVFNSGTLVSEKYNVLDIIVE